MKPWNERSGRIWAGSASIGRIGLAKGGLRARDRIDAAAGNQGGAGGMAPPSWLLRELLLTRPISTGDGVAAQRRNIARLGLGDACQARLFQFLVDADGSLVGPADHGE